jgi:hypothetical protein
MLLMTSNTRSGGVGQGRAFFARRAAVGAQRRALTDDGAEGIPPRTPDPVFSASSRAATAAFTHNSSRRLFFLLAA